MEVVTNKSIIFRLDDIFKLYDTYAINGFDVTQFLSSFIDVNRPKFPFLETYSGIDVEKKAPPTVSPPSLSEVIEPEIESEKEPSPEFGFSDKPPVRKKKVIIEPPGKKGKTGFEPSKKSVEKPPATTTEVIPAPPEAKRTSGFFGWFSSFFPKSPKPEDIKKDDESEESNSPSDTEKDDESESTEESPAVQPPVDIPPKTSDPTVPIGQFTPSIGGDGIPKFIDANDKKYIVMDPEKPGEIGVKSLKTDIIYWKSITDKEGIKNQLAFVKGDWFKKTDDVPVVINPPKKTIGSSGSNITGGSAQKQPPPKKIIAKNDALAGTQSKNPPKSNNPPPRSSKQPQPQPQPSSDVTEKKLYVVYSKNKKFSEELLNSIVRYLNQKMYVNITVTENPPADAEYVLFPLFLSTGRSTDMSIFVSEVKSHPGKTKIVLVMHYNEVESTFTKADIPDTLTNIAIPVEVTVSDRGIEHSKITDEATAKLRKILGNRNDIEFAQSGPLISTRPLSQRSTGPLISQKTFYVREGNGIHPDLPHFVSEWISPHANVKIATSKEIPADAKVVILPFPGATSRNVDLRTVTNEVQNTPGIEKIVLFLILADVEKNVVAIPDISYYERSGATVYYVFYSDNGINLRSEHNPNILNKILNA